MNQETKDHQDLLAKKVHQVHKDLRESQDQLVSRENAEPLDLLEKGASLVQP